MLSRLDSGLRTAGMTESRRYKNNLDNFIEVNKFLNNVCIIRVNFLRVNIYFGRLGLCYDLSKEVSACFEGEQFIISKAVR